MTIKIDEDMAAKGWTIELAEKYPLLFSRRMPSPIQKGSERAKRFIEAGQKSNRKKAANAARRRNYQERLSELKADQLDIAQDYIQNKGVPSPADLLMNMIKEQMMIVANPELSNMESNKERNLLMSMWDRYADLTGAKAPNSQTIDVTSKIEEKDSPEQVQEKLLQTTKMLNKQTNKEEDNNEE